MKTILLIFLIVASIQCGCSKATETNESGPTVEGIVGLHPPTMAIGGEADPPGYILRDYRWISGQPGFAYSRIYIEGPLDSSYLNKRVRVTGKIETISVGGVETSKRTFLRIMAERITTVD